MNQPYFSIVLATYNRRALLPRAIGSVLSQSFQDWELIVVDDGSPDESVPLIRSYETSDGRIHLVLKEHSGLSRTRNAGIARARGVYTAFLDSDDEFKPSHLHLHYEYLEMNPGLDLLHGKVEIIGDPYVPDRDDRTRKVHLEDCPAHVGSLFIRTTLLKEAGGFPVVDFAEDRALYDLLLTKNIRKQELAFRTYRYYRDQPDSICNTA